MNGKLPVKLGFKYSELPNWFNKVLLGGGSFISDTINTRDECYPTLHEDVTNTLVCVGQIIFNILIKLKPTFTAPAYKAHQMSATAIERCGKC